VKTYETLLVIHPDLDESEQNKTVDTIQELITTNGGKIIKLDKWGKRQLAYMIKKKRDGYYVLIYFEAPAAAIVELNRRYKLMPDVILRSIVLQLDAVQVADIFNEGAAEKKTPRARFNAAFDDDDDIPMGSVDELVASTEV
jgi:small subunit ribosomal protein S6